MMFLRRLPISVLNNNLKRPIPALSCNVEGASLFRQQVISARADRLSGDVSILVPVSWQAVGYLLFVVLSAALMFFSFARYARVETVGGAIVPDAGISYIVPSRSGVVTDLRVRDGDLVAAGTELVAIRTEEDALNGTPAADRIEKAIARKDASLTAQADERNAATSAQRAQLAAQRQGLDAEIAQLQLQINLQRNLIQSAQKDLERTRPVSERGFISQRDVQIREDAVLIRQQGLFQLAQNLASRRAALAEAKRGDRQLAAQSRAQAADIAASRADVAQQAATASGARAYVLRAPIDGRVTALTVRIGQPANPQSPLMTIVPTASVLRAELVVPSSAIGFIKAGQEVRVAVDTFPYQRFGTIKGTVLTVATSPVSRQTPEGLNAPMYPVTVALDQTSISAFGRQEVLVSGMTLTARIVIERQSLIELMFEPIFAVSNR